MFQKFYEDTIMSKFIKNLLATTDIPLLDFVNTGDFLIKGCNYIYNHNIIKCTHSGILNGTQLLELFPSEQLFPSNIYYPNSGPQIARYDVLAHYSNDEYKLFTYRYKSSYNYYDPITHKFLGAYLRYLKNARNLNLLPFYNCYNYYMIYDLHLVHNNQFNVTREVYSSKNRTFELQELTGYKLLAIPIQFGKTYTIAIDSNSPVLMRGIIYNSYGLIKSAAQRDIYYSDHRDLRDSYCKYTNLNFNRPITYSIFTDDPELYNQQKNLYLTIQLPVDNDSSIVVLEGDYTSDYPEQDIKSAEQFYYNGLKVPKNFNSQSNSINPRLSLLLLNTKESYAFSDRLIEYLLSNVIYSADDVYTNISRLQSLMNKNSEFTYTINPNTQLGMWDDDLTTSLNKLIQKYSTNYYLPDMDGNVNKHVESLLRKEGLKFEHTS